MRACKRGGGQVSVHKCMPGSQEAAGPGLRAGEGMCEQACMYTWSIQQGSLRHACAHGRYMHAAHLVDTAGLIAAFHQCITPVALFVDGLVAASRRI
jgi:hypothetical protein